MIVYTPEGVAEEKDACDARECVKYCGYSFDAPAPAAPAVPAADAPAADAPAPDAPAPGADIEQMRTELTLRGIPFHPNTGAKKLAELLSRP